MCFLQSPSLIDETIDKIIKDGLEYTEKVEMMKGTGGRVVPPHWMRIPKPTKFPSKQQTPQSLAKVFIHQCLFHCKLHNSLIALFEIKNKTNNNKIIK